MTGARAAAKVALKVLPTDTIPTEEVRWSRDGRELFYVSADRKLVAVPLRPGPTLQLGEPRTLFTLPGRRPWADYDVAPDGRFLAIVRETLGAEQPLTVLVGALSEASQPPRR